MSRYQPGTYVARVTEQGWETTKKEPPRDMIVLKINVLDKVIANPDGTESFQDVSMNSEYDQTVRLLLDPEKPKSMEFALKKLRNAGFTGADFGQLDLEGKDVRVRNEPTKDQNSDKVYDNWDLCLPPLDTPPVQPIDGKKARSLNSLFGKMLKETAVEQHEVPEPVETPEPVGAGIPDDEVPF